MKQLLTTLMLGNAALFVFGALQHAGVRIGPLHEPVIVPASIVEALCGLALGWGAAAVLKRSLKAWRAALIGNLVAMLGVAIGIDLSQIAFEDEESPNIGERSYAASPNTRSMKRTCPTIS